MFFNILLILNSGFDSVLDSRSISCSQMKDDSNDFCFFHKFYHMPFPAWTRLFALMFSHIWFRLISTGWWPKEVGHITIENVAQFDTLEFFGWLFCRFTSTATSLVNSVRKQYTERLCRLQGRYACLLGLFWDYLWLSVKTKRSCSKLSLSLSCDFLWWLIIIIYPCTSQLCLSSKILSFYIHLLNGNIHQIWWSNL